MPSTRGSAQLALAMIVLKSKPGGMSLEAYFAQLRQCIGSRSIPPEQHQHLDSVAFWRRAYEESEVAQAKLLDRIYELEQDHTTSRTGLASIEVTASPVVSNKRKRKNESTAKAHSQSTRRAVFDKATLPPQSGHGDSPITARRSEPNDLQNSGPVAFVRRFFNLRQQIRSKRPDGCALRQALRDLCRAAATLITESTSTVVPSRTTKTASAQDSSPTLSCIALATQRSYPSILQGLDKLCAKSPGTGQPGSVVYESVVLFEAIMAKINMLAVQEASDTDQGKPKAKKVRVKSGMPPQSRKPSSHEHHTAFQSLACLAISMLTTVDPSKEPQSQILEGCLCAFLDHLGSSLSLAVFTDHTSPEQPEIFRGVLPPQGLKDLSDLDSRTALRAVQLEAPYLISILEQAMAFVNSQRATMPSQFFAHHLKEKLQQTLLKGVFGDDDEMFRDVLQRPLEPEGGLDDGPPAQPRHTETSDGFTGEVWRILGWNILAGHDASFDKTDIESGF